jgi:hypothetical protein
MGREGRSLVAGSRTRAAPACRFVLPSLLMAAACWAGLAAISAGQSGGKTIAWRAQQQETLRVRMIHRMRTEIPLDQKPSAMSLLTAMELRWRLTDAGDPGKVAIEQKIERLILQSTEADGRTWDFDTASADPAPPELRELADALRPLIGSRVTIVLDARGQIQDVQRSSETDRWLAEMPAAARWKNLLTRDGMRQMLRQALGPLPDRPVVSGDRWQEVRTLQTPLGQITLIDRFEYQGTVIEQGRELARIDRTTSLRRDESDAELFAESSAPTSHQDSGTLYFDSDAGRLVRSRNHHRWTSEIVVDDQRLLVSSSGTLDTDIEPLDVP